MFKYLIINLTILFSSNGGKPVMDEYNRATKSGSSESHVSSDDNDVSDDAHEEDDNNPQDLSLVNNVDN